MNFKAIFLNDSFRLKINKLISLVFHASMKVGSIAEKMHNPLTSTLFANDCYHHGPYETPKKGS